MTGLQFRVSVFNELLQTKYKRWELKICFVRKAIEYVIQSIQTSLEILCRETIKINDNRHNYDFIPPKQFTSTNSTYFRQ